MACLLLVIPGLQVAGAAVAFATMGGAIMLHLFTALGVDPYNDGGTLFKEACTNLVFAAIILFLRRDEILPLVRRLVTDPRAVRSLPKAEYAQTPGRSSCSSIGTRQACTSRLVSLAIPTTAISSPSIAVVRPLLRAAAEWLAMQ